MDKYAIVSVNGGQERVSVGDTVAVKGQLTGDSFTFGDVLYVSGDPGVAGKPLVSGAEVAAQILDSYKGSKIRVAKFKAKSKYHKVMGYRDLYTLVKIIEIKYSA